MMTIFLIWLLFGTSLFTKLNIQVMRLYEMDSCFRDGQIPCRWVPGLENFYGSPKFNYSAPLSYYFGEFIFFITKNLSLSIKVILSMSLIGSYIFMYFFTSHFVSKRRAYILAIFYTLLSFWIVIVSSEGLGLVLGLMLFPLILLSLNLLLQKRKIQNFLLFSLSLSLLILSTDKAYIFIGLIFLWISYHCIRIRSFTFLLLSLSSMIFASLISSFYLFPAILERDLIHNVSVNDPFGYLPKSAVEKPKRVADTPYQILTGDSDVFNFKQGTNWLRFETNTKTHTIIRLSQFYFPNWKIFIDGKETQVEYKNNSLGLMTIILGKGQHTVEGRLSDTPIRAISNLVTIISAITVLLLWIIQFKGVQRSLNYYKKRVH